MQTRETSDLALQIKTQRLKKPKTQKNKTKNSPSYLNNMGMEDYISDKDQKQNQMVSCGSPNKKRYFHNKKQSNLPLGEITCISHQNTLMGMMQGKSQILKTQNFNQTDKIMKSNKIANQNNTPLVLYDTLNFETQYKFMNRQRQKLLIRKRMKKNLINSQKQSYIVKIEENFFNDDVLIYLNDQSEKIQKCMQDQIIKSFFGKQINIKSQYSMIGRIQGNFMGSIFNVYQIDQDQLKKKLIATIYYQTSCSIATKPRKVQIYVRNPQNQNNQKIKCLNLKEYYEQQQNENKVIKLRNIQSIYNIKKNNYCIPSGQKYEILPSVHNCILTDGIQKVLKFYQIQKNRYSLIIKNPLSPLIAYCYLVSSFCFKISCQ